MTRPLPRLLAISDPQARQSRQVHWCIDAFSSWLAELAAAGIRGLQLREKAAPDRAVYDLACEARSALGAEATILVNGRFDIALAAGADGAHLPADGVPLDALRRHCGPEFRVGVSTHELAEVAAAAAAGASYALFGPIWETPGKPGPAPGRSPVGLAGLRAAVAAGLPVYALGGVSAERLVEVAAAGAAGAAGIRMFHDPASLAAIAAAASAAFGSTAESAR